MAKPLMPYGSKGLSSLMTKYGDVAKLSERSSAKLAMNAFASSRGNLAKGGWGKLSGLESEASRLVRLNAGVADKND